MRHNELHNAALLQRINRRLEPGGDRRPAVIPGGSGPGGVRAQVIAGLESKVSLLQVASGGIKKTQAWLNEMDRFLEEAKSPRAQEPLAPTVANRFIEDRLGQIQMITSAVSFSGQALLNGKSGVLGRADGAGLQFVKGSARTRSSQGRGYPVAIEWGPKSASLMGNAPLNPSEIQKEAWIGFKEGGAEARYKVRGDEQPKELVARLQESVDRAGLDLSVYLTRDMRLLILSNRLGSGPRFEGVSQKTRLISSRAGEGVLAEPGRDINGQIGTEPAQGQGGFLIGAPGNARTDGLKLYYDGEAQYPGQIVGYVEVVQKGLLVPMDLETKEVEILSLPALGPELLAVGIKNPSGFKSLGQIRAGSQVERRDAQKLVAQARGELSDLAEELKWKEEVYVGRATDLLKAGFEPRPTGADLLGLSQDKAKIMASQLRGILDHPVA